MAGKGGQTRSVLEEEHGNNAQGTRHEEKVYVRCETIRRVNVRWLIGARLPNGEKADQDVIEDHLVRVRLYKRQGFRQIATSRCCGHVS